jgi:mannose-6-phosphate isomerase-like protein (cupin superfamily)
MPEYQIHLEDKFGSLQLIDVVAEAAAVTEQWVNQTLTTVNDSLVRLGVVEGEFHWHKHDAEDEFFYVVEGDLEIEVEGRESFRLGPGQGVTIPRGVMHRPIAHTRTAMLMVEPATITPVGDAAQEQ